MLIWPLDTAISTPLGRNKIAMALWTTVFWSVLAAYVWQVGDALWQGSNRFILLGLALIGTLMAAVTGALGGVLAGNPTPVARLIRAFNWEIYTTAYVPMGTVVALVVIALLLVVIGLLGHRASD